MQVSGRMLLAMTDTLLIELGVKNASHRLAIKFAIEDLQAASCVAAVDRAAAGAPGSDAQVTQRFNPLLVARILVILALVTLMRSPALANLFLVLLLVVALYHAHERTAA